MVSMDIHGLMSPETAVAVLNPMYMAVDALLSLQTLFEAVYGAYFSFWSVVSRIVGMARVCRL